MKMQKDLFGLPEPKYNILTGKRVGSKRKAFPIKTKKIEWTKAAGRDPYDYIAHRKFVKTSKCRDCGRPLTWGDRTYDFDHRDNNPANISQKNCYLVCKVCHGKATVITKRKTKGFLEETRYKTIKKKVGYKKPKKKTTTKKRRKKKSEDIFEIPKIRLL